MGGRGRGTPRGTSSRPRNTLDRLRHAGESPLARRARNSGRKARLTQVRRDARTAQSNLSNMDDEAQVDDNPFDISQLSVSRGTGILQRVYRSSIYARDNVVYILNTNRSFPDALRRLATTSSRHTIGCTPTGKGTAWCATSCGLSSVGMHTQDLSKSVTGKQNIYSFVCVCGSS